jgi:CHAD domain-containing protein
MRRASADIEDSTAIQKKLLKLTRKRFERFVTLMPKFLVNEEPDTIHDLRVWSRRLQQTLRVILGETKGSRKAMRLLRRTRRALGTLRNLDVIYEFTRQRAQEASSAAIREGWNDLGAYLKESRESLLVAARNEISKHDLMKFIARVRELTSDANFADPTAQLEAAVAGSLGEWDQAYGLADEMRSAENVHALRIATKRLRYRAEILTDIGRGAVAPMVKDLKEIQEALGNWHDRSVLMQSAGEFLARPDFLAQHPDRAGALLAEMEKEKRSNDGVIESILPQAAKLRKRWHNAQSDESRTGEG